MPSHAVIVCLELHNAKIQYKLKCKSSSCVSWGGHYVPRMPGHLKNRMIDCVSYLASGPISE